MTADPDRRTVAARLAAERTRRGLTKRELGRRLASQVTEQCPSLDTLVSYVKRWEAGKVSVSDRYRHAYSKALGMSPEELAAIRPGLIYVSISCYGAGGPLSGRGGWEQIAQCSTGICKDNGDAARPKLLPV